MEVATRSGGPAGRVPAVGTGRLRFWPGNSRLLPPQPQLVPGVVPAPERPPEPRASAEDPAPGLAGDGCAGAAAPCPASAPTACPAAQPGLPEKLREGPRAPPLHLRAESAPVHTTCGFPAPVPPARTMESKAAAASIHCSGGSEASGSGAGCHPFGDDVPPLPLPVLQPKHAAPPKAPYSAFPRPDVIAPEPFGPENCVHFSMTPNCHQYRPPSVPPHHSGLEPPHAAAGAYGARSEPPASLGGPRYNTYVAPGRSTAASSSSSGHPSKPPCGRLEYVSSLSSSVRGGCYPEDISSVYPTIRRVQSLHTPPAAAVIRSVPISRTEVPPDDDEPVAAAAYCPRPLYPYKPYPASQARSSDYHVTQLQPYFENGRVHYRYSPYSSSGCSSSSSTATATYYGPDGSGGGTTLCDLDAYGTVQLRPLHHHHHHRLPGRDLAFHTPRLQGKGLYGYGYPTAAGLPPPRPRAALAGYFPGSDHGLVGVSLAGEGKHAYASWDLEDMEKYRLQSLRRESRARQKVKGPVMSQYDNMMGEELGGGGGGIYVIHLRSKSDPGKTGLLSVAEGKEAPRPPGKALSPEGGDPFYRKHPEAELDRAHHHHGHGGHGHGNGQPEKPSLPQKQSSLRNRKLHDTGCGGLPEHRAPQEASHRHPCEPRNGPPHPQGAGLLDYGSKGSPDACEPASYHHNSAGKYMTLGPESLRLNHKEAARLCKELERPRARQPRDCYAEDEPQLGQASVPPPKPERSHSLKLHHTQSGEQRDPGALCQYPAHGRRQGSLATVSQYDNLEGYHSPPQLQRGGFPAGGAVGAYLPPGFAHPQSRTYATALGQGAFLPAELALQQHPETQVHAE